MRNAFDDLVLWQQIVFILAVFTGVTQLALFLGMIVHGGRVTIWWGLICMALVVVLLVTA